jgi:hypothetical protein
VHVVAIPQSIRGEAVPDGVVAERLIDPGMERLWRPSIQRTDHPVATAVQDMDVSSCGCLRASGHCNRVWPERLIKRVALCGAARPWRFAGYPGSVAPTGRDHGERPLHELR